MSATDEDARFGQAWRALHAAVPPDVPPTTTIASNSPGVWLVHTSFGMESEDDFEVFAPSVLEGLLAVTHAIQQHRRENPDCPSHVPQRRF